MWLQTRVVNQSQHRPRGAGKYTQMAGGVIWTNHCHLFPSENMFLYERHAENQNAFHKVVNSLRPSDAYMRQ